MCDACTYVWSIIDACFTESPIYLPESEESRIMTSKAVPHETWHLEDTLTYDNRVPIPPNDMNSFWTYNIGGYTLRDINQSYNLHLFVSDHTLGSARLD